MSFSSPNDVGAGRIALASKYDGPVRQAIRWLTGPDGQTSCGLSSLAMADARSAATLFFDPSGVAALFSSDAGPALGPVLPEGQSPSGEPTDSVLVGNRLVWRWGGGGSLTSVDALTGGGETPLADANGLGSVDYLSATPDFAIFGIYQDTAALYATDGISPPVPFAATPGALAALPRWADGWIVWFLAYGASPDLSTFSKIEIWQAPYDKDLTKLVPTKLSDYPAGPFQDAFPAAGSGHLGFFTGDKNTMVPFSLHVIDPDTGLHRSIELPPGRSGSEVAGFTDTHVVFTTGPGFQPADGIYRVPLAGLTPRAFP